jgi:hypothetical protein
MASPHMHLFTLKAYNQPPETANSVPPFRGDKPHLTACPKFPLKPPIVDLLLPQDTV